MKKLIIILVLFTACKSSVPYKTRFYSTNIWGWYGSRDTLTNDLTDDIIDDTTIWFALPDTYVKHDTLRIDSIYRGSKCYVTLPPYYVNTYSILDTATYTWKTVEIPNKLLNDSARKQYEESMKKSDTLIVNKDTVILPKSGTKLYH